MNKYWEALSSLHDFVGGEIGCAAIFFEIDGITYEALDTVEELVEKATPKKPNDLIYHNDGYIKFFAGKCPNCETVVNDDYSFCFECGQAIDWSEEDGKTD